MADFSLVADAAQAALEGRQLQPVLLGPRCPLSAPLPHPSAGGPEPAGASLLAGPAPPFRQEKAWNTGRPCAILLAKPDELSAIRHRADKEVSHMDRGMKNGSTGVSMSSSLWLVFSRASSVSCLWSPPLSFCWACIISGRALPGLSICTPMSPSTTLGGGSSYFPPPASAWASFGSPSPSPPGPPNGAP